MIRTAWPWGRFVTWENGHVGSSPCPPMAVPLEATTAAELGVHLVLGGLDRAARRDRRVHGRLEAAGPAAEGPVDPGPAPIGTDRRDPVDHLVTEVWMSGVGM